MNTKEKFDSHYSNAAERFANAIAGLKTKGIPEPHLPHWGRLYDESALKVGIIGRDTRGWGELPSFLEAVRNNPIEAVHRGGDDFENLAFTQWTNNFGKTFWDTTFRILAGLHNINDWRRLKNCQDENVLRSFFWANTNSIERYEDSPQKNGVDFETWRKVKDASEVEFDSLKNILNVFNPHIVFLMNWDSGSFIDVDLTWEEYGDHQAYAFDGASNCHVLATAHPTWLNTHGIYDEAVNGIIAKANTML